MDIIPGLKWEYVDLQTDLAWRHSGDEQQILSDFVISLL